MATEMLTCGQQFGERLNCSPQSARALIRRLRLPRQKANDGKVLVAVDLTDTNKAMPRRSPRGHCPLTPQMGRKSLLAWSPYDSASEPAEGPAAISMVASVRG
jgi:hypothetical protein